MRLPALSLSMQTRDEQLIIKQITSQGLLHPSLHGWLLGQKRATVHAVVKCSIVLIIRLGNRTEADYCGLNTGLN